MSTTEAEYRALADGAKEAVHLNRLLQELQLSSIGVSLTCSEDKIIGDLSQASFPTEIDLHLHCDNVSAIKLARNPVFHARSKHIELHHHYVRERVLAGEIKVDYLRTEEQTADVLTKALSQPTLEKHRRAMGIQSVEQFKSPCK